MLIEIARSQLSLPMAALSALALVLIWTRSRKSSPYKLPPGPSPEPLIGHLRIMPTEYQWKEFANWKKRWGTFVRIYPLIYVCSYSLKLIGDIIYVSIVGRPTVIVNSVEIARDLMDKRGANYSDRPRMVMHGEL